MSPTSNHQNSMASTFQSTPIDASIELAEPNRRKQHFRSLVSDIAEHLDARDVDKIIWQKELPQKMKDKPALAVLEWLYSHGDYSMDEVRPLAQLLKAIHREDITEKVESYQEKFGEPDINSRILARSSLGLTIEACYHECISMPCMMIDLIEQWIGLNMA